MDISSDDIFTASQVPVGRIGDLKVEVVPEELKARLSWTSPDIPINRYEVRYAYNVEDIADHFEINGKKWEDTTPFPLSPASEMSFNVQLDKKNFLDKPLYFAIKTYPQSSFDNAGTVSNWVRIFMPSPPPPPTIPPTYTSNDQSSWPFQVNSGASESAGPSIVKTMTIGLEIILPVVIGVIILIVLLIVYCYFCVLRRKNSAEHKKAKQNAMSDKLNSTITIIPSSPHNSPQNTGNLGYTNHADIPDHHTLGVPINTYDSYDDEPKKNYSLVHQQEQQLIEELKQQQMHHHQREQMNTPNNNYGGLAVISNGTLQRNGHTLSPYNSWSASQLLHEHERRHSPMENMMQDEQLMNQHQEMLLNGSQIDHMSLNGQNLDHISMNGHQIANQIPEHYPQTHIPPPVPPLPAFNGYPVNYNIYGVHQPQMVPGQQNHQIYQSMQRNEPLVPYNPSLQGSVSSVNSGEKKRRNVTMV